MIFPGDSEMARRMRALDWSSTPMGPPDRWPQSLRTALRICLASRFPIHVWWGPALTLFYNDACISLLGPAKHPAALGRSGREAWAAIAEQIAPMIERAWTHREASWSEDILMHLDRQVPREEVHLTFSFSPVLAADDAVEGMFCACVETTDTIIGNRRVETLRRLGSRVVEARTAEDACLASVGVLAANPLDLPHAAIHLVDEDGRRTLGAATAGGAPADGDPRTLELEIPGGRPDRSAAGILSVTASDRRPVDATYRAFLGMVASQIGTAITDARASGEEHRQAEAIAVLDRGQTGRRGRRDRLGIGARADDLHSPQPTPREAEVLRLLAWGRSNKEAAAVLGISVKTVEYHKSRVLARLGLRGRGDVLRYALRAGWLDSLDEA